MLLDRGLVNAAASRLYYSLFQAAVHSLESQKHTPASLKLNAETWEHGMICNNTKLVRGNPSDRKLFEIFRSMREEADYSKVSVEVERVTSRLAAVRQLVEEATE